MEKEYEMNYEIYNFRRNSSQSSDKLTTLREQSQASHINRIRFAIEKRKKLDLEQLNLGKPKWSNNMTSKKTIKKAKSTRIFSRKMELDGAQLIDDNETNRFLTLHGDSSYCRSLEHSVNNGEDHEAEGEIHLITTSHDSKRLKSVKNGGKKKHRKRWTKTTETMLIVPLAENENATERNGGDYCSEKSLSMRNIEEFNRIQNERDVESLDYIEEKAISRRHATENDGRVVQWIDSLPTPESMDPILDTAQDAKSDLHLSSKEDSFATLIDPGNHSQTSARGYKVEKYCKKSTRKGAKQSNNTSGLGKNMLDECTDKENGFNSVLKNGESSTPIGLKIKNDGPIQVVYTSKGNLKITIRLRKLKPKDTALLVRFGDLKNLTLNEKDNTTSSRKVKKAFTYLNDQQMEFFENIFLK